MVYLGIRTITVCEIKHHDGEYELTSADLEAMRTKKAELRKYLQRKRVADRNLLIAYITLSGIKRNRYYNEMQPEVVCLEDLVW